MPEIRKYTVVDLFAGVGGLSYGFSRNDRFEIILANEMQKDIAKAYTLNHPSVNMLQGDIKDLSEDVLRQAIGNRTVDVVPENQSQYDKRFLSRVVTNPVKVMPTIQMNFMQLKSRAQKSNRMGTYNAINNQIMDLIDMLDGNYPGRLTQVQRGEFFIGYNQQMHYNRDTAIAKKREKEENTIAMSAVNTVATVDETTVA